MLTLIIIILLTAILCCYSFGHVTHPRLAYYKDLLKVMEREDIVANELCAASFVYLGVSIYYNMEQKVPELFALKPAVTCNESYWFKRKDKAPRIALLKQVIKNCKDGKYNI